MAAITSAIVGAAGLGLSAYGMNKERSSVKAQNKEIAKSNAAQAKVAKASKDASAASLAAEKVRLQQMELEGIRRRRDIMRQAQAARSLGLARANAQGALSAGTSSAVAGQQQMASLERADTLANNQNISIGRQIFAENKKIYDAQARGAQYQSQSNLALANAQAYGNQSSYASRLFGAGMNIAGSAVAAGNVAETMFGRASGMFADPWAATVTPSIYSPLK